ncbi:SDR family oxidoreductase [Scytonema hofmannii]|uniref:SDR family oxidoreductase n=1 Tax=Scytonema hofmannii TaxID=34078 RepID=UPI0009D77283|nr:SDR family oxidoreductase [Scytonema hofmannii]
MELSTLQINTTGLRLREEAEIARSVVFLCAHAASYITGQALSIDGGHTVGRSRLTSLLPVNGNRTPR